jgi:hypothetical protein
MPEPEDVECSACDGLGDGEKEVQIDGHPNARLACCGVCHRTRFRHDANSYVWKIVSDPTVAARLKRQFTAVWL